MKKILLSFTLLFSLLSLNAFAQPANDDCTTAQSLGTLPTPAACPSGVGANVNVAGTLAGATPANPYVFQNGCSGAGGPNMGVPANDVWYTFVASGYDAIINVTSTFANPNIAMYAGNCASLGGGVGGCAVGTGGTASLTVQQMVIGTTYYIQISGNVGQTGTFNLSVHNNKGCNDCLNASTLTVTPPPVNGMYNPGQTVNFCYHISQYSQINTNWEHGVQIAFGSGWNAGSIVPSPPGSVSGDGVWGWYPAGITDAQGNAWPPGFYYDSNNNGSGFPIPLDGNPGNNYGDYNASTNLTAGQWNFCFTITTNAGCSPGSNLSVTINTSGDGESGIWTNLGCINDPSTVFNAVGACCQPNMSSVAASCAGNDGTATATPVGTSGPYDYVWTNAGGSVVSSTSGVAGANTATGLTPGVYTVAITNALNCLATNTVTVGGVGTPPTPTAGSNSPICEGGTLNLTAANVAGATYSWTGPNSFASAIQNPSIASVTLAASGAYTVTANVGGCISTSTTNVTINPVPTVTVPANIVVCASGAVAATAFTSTPAGATFAWTNSNTAIGIAASGAGNIAGFTATNATASPITATITVTPTLAGCPGTPNSYTITVNPTPTVVAPANITICNGGNIAATNFTSPTAGATFAWTNSNTAIGLAASGAGNIASFTATNTGAASITATVTVTPTANGCPGTPSTYTITVNPTPTVVVPANITVCDGGNVAATNFTSPTAGATFAWTNSNTAIGLAASGAGNIAAFTAANTGTATITATITVTPTANGCPGTPSSYTITVNPTPTVIVPANITICDGGNVAATNFTSPTAGATFTWTNSNSAIGLAASGVGNIASFTATNTGSAAITATITVTPSANGCPGTPNTYTITVNPTPTVVVPANIAACVGTNIPASNFTSPVAGATFAWTNSNTAIGLAASGAGNTPSFNATNSGVTAITATITVTPTANGCPGTPSTYTITVNPNLIVNAGPDDTICFGGSTLINATPNGAGYTYSWTPAAGLSSTSIFNPTANPAATTAYTITTTDPNGCTGTDNITIYSDPQITISKTAVNVTCNGACDGQTIVIPAGGSGGYTYSWTSGCISAACNGLCPGSYTVTVTDSWGCTATADTSVTQPPLLVASIPTSSPTSCNGSCDATANATAIGGTPGATGYTYSWNTVPAQLTSNATGLCAGPYTVTVKDANNCVATANVTILQPSPVTLQPVAPVTICIGSSTTLTAIASGGNGGYHYSWLPAGTGGDTAVVTVSPVLSTTYTVNVTDANGCTAPPLLIVVNVYPQLHVVAAGTNSICPGASTPINAVASGGNGGPYSYTWLPATGLTAANVANPNASPATTTTYTVVATDNCGTPFAVDSVTVTILPLPVIVFSGDPQAGCAPVCVNFFDSTTVAGGTVAAWTWNFGDAAANPASTNNSNLQNPSHCFTVSGLYSISLTATSNNGCVSTITYNNYINAYANPTAEFNATPNPATVLDPVITFNNQSSSDVSAWYWYFGDGDTLAPLVSDPVHAYPTSTADTYTALLYVMNPNGCWDTISHDIIIGPEFTFFIPNAFTPNGDGVNDTFFGTGIGIKKYELFIFDRWGNQIYYADDLYKAWDGKANHGSDMAQQDVYVWKVRLTDVFDKKHNYIGTVTIVK